MIYEYVDQDGVHEISRQEILKTFYPYWASEMLIQGKQDLINEDNCVDDFVIVHWARKKLE